MIRTLVFDVGNVLTWWKPREFCKSLFPDDPALAEIVADQAFGDPRWFEGDTGETTMAELARSIAAKEPRQVQDAAVYAFTHFPDALIPNTPLIGFLKVSKAKGYGCYLLSNYCELFEQSLRSLGLLDIVDGYVYSYKERIRKPDHRLYRLLVERYGLEASECLFIDDKAANVVAAKEAGFGYGFVYAGNDEEFFDFVRKNGLFC